MIRKICSLILAVMVLLSVTLIPVSAADKKLKFSSDGTFRIMQIADFQDTDTTNADSLAFLDKALQKYKPDLVVFSGDQIRDGISGATVERLKTALYNQLKPLEDKGIPFIFTFGNHDRDYISIFPMEEQAAYYRSFSNCYANADGIDGGTYNTVIYKKDGKTPALNIYMMDTQHWNGRGDTSGVTPEQVQWYIDTSNSLKKLNGGNVIPSLVFQHIPVKETYQLLKIVPSDTPGAIKGKFTSDYYILDENADWLGDRNVMREVPASEHPSKTTGQYEAWLQQGDIIGAYFGHDHINTFVGRTAEGIILGYCGGFGFATYGDPGERYAAIYVFNENDIENYTRSTVYYTETITYEPPAEPEEPKEETLTFWQKFVQFFRNILNFFLSIFE